MGGCQGSRASPGVDTFSGMTEDLPRMDTIAPDRPVRILVLGSVNIDLVASVRALPRRGETVLGRSLRVHDGGKGANQAVAAAAAGGAVSLIGAVGRDAYGERVRRTLESRGIDLAHTETLEEPTGTALIWVEETGGNSIVVVPGANASLSPAHVERADIAFRSAHTLLTQLEIPLEAAVAGLAAAHRLGIRTILNPAPAARLPPDVLALVDVLTPNESEAEQITGRKVITLEDAGAAVEHLLTLGPRAVALTMGASGVHVGSRDGLRAHVPAFPVRATDSTGAGDVFNGALAVALSEGSDLAAAARFASAAAAISVTRNGALHSAPQRAEIETLLRTGRM